MHSGALPPVPIIVALERFLHQVIIASELHDALALVLRDGSRLNPTVFADSRRWIVRKPSPNNDENGRFRTKALIGLIGSFFPVTDEAAQRRPRAYQTHCGWKHAA